MTVQPVAPYDDEVESFPSQEGFPTFSERPFTIGSLDNAVEAVQGSFPGSESPEAGDGHRQEERNPEPAMRRHKEEIEIVLRLGARVRGRARDSSELNPWADGAQAPKEIGRLSNAI